ncbi:MAG TPA: glycosyltransferase [Gemmataceae bacterium]|nr:glycosyltransferase [Gemmataceae bacterium]
MNVIPKYSFVIPTYRRPDTLELCLEHIAELDNDPSLLEVIVVDNGAENNSAFLAEKFRGRLNLTYRVNERNQGPGYSHARGVAESRGQRIVIMNDDALVPRDFLRACDSDLDADPCIGCLGFRALENAYCVDGNTIGRITPTGQVLGNFVLDCGKPIEVEHIYGFCYLITRATLEQSAKYDRILLTKHYASGDRLETDHCLSIRRRGFKVVYDPRIMVQHLAKPRLDYKERSLRWRLNHIRNTLYLFLKHYGVFGKRGVAVRYALTHDLGIRSAFRWPTYANWAYFLTGLRARVSAFGHYVLYLASL